MLWLFPILEIDPVEGRKDWKPAPKCSCCVPELEVVPTSRDEEGDGVAVMMLLGAFGPMLLLRRFAEVLKRTTVQVTEEGTIVVPRPRCSYLLLSSLSPSSLCVVAPFFHASWLAVLQIGWAGTPSSTGCCTQE